MWSNWIYYMTSSVNGQDEPNPRTVIGHPSRQDGAILPPRDTGFVPPGQFIAFWCFIPYNPLLTKFVRSRWLDIGLTRSNIQPSWPHAWAITCISQRVAKMHQILRCDWLPERAIRQSCPFGITRSFPQAGTRILPSFIFFCVCVYGPIRRTYTILATASRSVKIRRKRTWLMSGLLDLTDCKQITTTIWASVEPWTLVEWRCLFSLTTRLLSMKGHLQNFNSITSLLDLQKDKRPTGHPTFNALND